MSKSVFFVIFTQGRTFSFEKIIPLPEVLLFPQRSFLDELISSVKEARKALVDVEDQPDEVIEKLGKEFETLRERLEPNKPQE